MDPLSKRLNGLCPKVSVDTGDLVYTCNHLLFIDDLKLIALSKSVLNAMVDETKKFFEVVGLEMNVEKSATNSSLCSEEAKLLESHEGYKYLEVIENSDGRTSPETYAKIVESIKLRVAALCKTNLNAKNLIKAVNEHAISLINYYVGIVDIEPDQFKNIDNNIRQIKNKFNHARLYRLYRLYKGRSSYVFKRVVNLAKVWEHTIQGGGSLVCPTK